MKFHYLLLIFWALQPTFTIAQKNTTKPLESYSFATLDSLYDNVEEAPLRLEYGLALLQKAKEKFSSQDTSLAAILFKVGLAYRDNKEVKETID